MWRIEVEAQTNDAEVKSRILADVASWRELTSVSVTTRDEDAWSGTVHVETSSSATVGAVAVTTDDDDAAPPPQRFGPPRQLSLDELAVQAPFGVFVPDPAPDTIPDVMLDPGGDAILPTSATVTYSVMDRDRPRGNVWLTLSGRPLPLIRFDAWRSIDDVAVCEDRSGGYYRCKVRLERDGTHVQVESTAHRTLDEVLAFARSLVPYAIQ